MNFCCSQEENLQVRFIRVGLSKDDEGNLEPIHIYCSICGNIVKEIGAGGYWGTLITNDK